MTERTQGVGVHSVRVALDVLEAVAFSGQELGVTQVAERLGLTKGSVHRHLLTLVQRGYLTQNQTTSRYGIGSKASMLARLAPDADIVRIAEGLMRELRDRCGHSVVLSSMTQRGAQVMLTIAGTSAIEIGVRPGSELPFHASAQGKVMLAFAPRSMQSRILAAPRPRFTPHTMTDAAEIERELVRILQRGYCVAPEEALLASMPSRRRSSTSPTPAWQASRWLVRFSSCRPVRRPHCSRACPHARMPSPASSGTTTGRVSGRDRRSNRAGNGP